MRRAWGVFQITLLFAVASTSASAQAPVAAGATAPSSRSVAVPAPAPAYEADPKFVTTIAEGKKFIHERQYLFAVEAYKKANKIAGGSCVGCFEQIYDLQMAMAKYKNAVATSSQLEALATVPFEKSKAEGERGKALLLQGGDKPRPAQLEAAHSTLQSALAIYPKNNAARFSDGCVLARMGNTEEASKQFAACAEAASSKDPMKVRARHFAQNPALSMAKMAPAFAVTALDGSHFNLDDVGGRVVLIDFWATWCGPCNAELPHLKKIAQEFAEQPLVIISISWDSDEGKWKQFIEEHQMTWVQYRDADHSLSTEFGINSIPHYFTIDSDGVLTAEMMGSGSDVEGKLKKLLKRAHEARAGNMQVAVQAPVEAGGNH